MMPFEPEPLESLKARFPKALEKVWEVTEPMPDRPGLHRENLFDFESGMRLLISKDMLMRGEPGVHVSASWEHDSPTSLHQMDTLVKTAYEVLGGKGTLRLIGFSNGGVPHWILDNE